MVGYTESFWHTFNNDNAFKYSNEEREDKHARNRQSLFQLELQRQAKLNPKDDNLT